MEKPTELSLKRLGILIERSSLDQLITLAEELPLNTADHPIALRLIGSWLETSGHLEAAVACFRQAARLSPLDPTAWVVLGNSLQLANHLGAAAVAYDAALRLHPRGEAELCARARLFSRQGDPIRARAMLFKALDAAPRSPQALLGMGRLAADVADFAEAERWADLLEEVHRGADLSWLRLRIDVGTGRFAAAERRARSDLKAPGLTALQKADTLLLLGEALEGAGRAAEAFDAATEGKGLQRRFYAERAAGREGEAAKLARLAAWFETCDPAPWMANATEMSSRQCTTHVFLIGFPRSGTTLLEQALAAHPDVTALEEAPTFAAAYAEFLTSGAGLERLARLSPQAVLAWRERYWLEVKRFGGPDAARVFIDKNPAATSDLPLIAKLFPDAKILFARRDPRDVVLSCFRSNFQINATTYAFTSLEDAARVYDACMTMARRCLAVLPVQPLYVDHEVLVRDFEQGLNVLCRFIGIEPTPIMLDVAAAGRTREVRTPSARQLREGLSTRGVGRWRRYEDQLSPVLPILDPWVKELGYA